MSTPERIESLLDPLSDQSLTYNCWLQRANPPQVLFLRSSSKAQYRFDVNKSNASPLFHGQKNKFFLKISHFHQSKSLKTTPPRFGVTVAIGTELAIQTSRPSSAALFAFWNSSVHTKALIRLHHVKVNRQRPT